MGVFGSLLPQCMHQRVRMFWQRSMISCLPMLQCFAWVEANLWLDAGSTDALVLSTTGLPARPGGCSGRVRGPRKSHMLSRLHPLIASYRQPNILVFFFCIRSCDLTKHFLFEICTRLACFPPARIHDAGLRNIIRTSKHTIHFYLIELHCTELELSAAKSNFFLPCLNSPLTEVPAVVVTSPSFCCFTEQGNQILCILFVPSQSRKGFRLLLSNPFLLWLGTLESEMKNALGAVSLPHVSYRFFISLLAN